MILENGCRVLVVHRRLFEGDQARYFIGVVDGYESGLVRVTGYTWTRDQLSGTFVRKKDARTKIISLTSGSVIVYQLSTQAYAEHLHLLTDADGNPRLSDGKGLQMDLAEMPHRGGHPVPSVRGA